MKHIANRILIFITALLIPGMISGQNLTNDPSVKTGLLKNGFRYYIKRNVEPAGRATIYLANKAGSILETEEERGIAHFIEHMNFNGTKHFPKNELISYLERSGVKFGADLNAYTGFDETVYQLPLPTDNAELWSNGLQIMRDWAADATLDQTEFEKERGVIQEERRMRKDAGSRIAEQYRPILYNHSRYADRMPIGKDNVVLKSDVSVARNFYKRWYRPDLQALIIAGDIDVDAVEKQVIKLFSDLRSPAHAVPRKTYTIALKKSTDFLRTSDPEFSQSYIQFYFKQVSYPVKTREDFRKQLVERLTNMLYANRLSAVYNNSKPAYMGASAAISPLIANIDALTLNVALNPEKIKSSFDTFWTEMERVKRFGFTADEILAVKERFNRSMELALSEKNKAKSAGYAENYLQHFLKGDAYHSVEERDKLYHLYIGQITGKEIAQYLGAYLKSADQTILVLGPDKEKDQLPDQQLLNKWMHAVEITDIKPYQAEKAAGSLLTQIPVPGKIVKEDQVNELGIYHWQLDNGMNIYAKPTDFKNNQVLFTGFSHGGTSLYNDADFYSAKNAASFITSSGLGQFNAGQLDQILNKKALQVQPYITDRAEGFSGASASGDLPAAFEMLYLYMTAAKLDTSRFNRILTQSKSAFRNRTPDPERDFSDTIGYVLSGYHPRRKPAAIENFDQIDSAKVRAIFRERFSNPGDFTFVFTGNFNVDSLKIWTANYLGAVPPDGNAERAKDLHIRVPEGKIRKDLRAGKSDKATVQFVLSGKYDYGIKSNLYLDLLKAALQFRLNTRLREVEGGVYSPQVYLTKAKEPVNFYAYTISFECDPARMEQLITAAKEEIAKLSISGATAEEVQKFVAEESRANELALRSNEFWLNTIQSSLNNNEPLLSVLAVPADLKRLDSKESQQYSLQLLNQQNEIIFTLRP
ncbi:M16 family metallopeptidase [Pedobacter sp. MR2016-24]|uniref:M16 family metallopeptidase n=1 Tax=Pedobacter sp. MR2016-24 TaxID=2994466 RepID=UPI0022478A61|nr:M16 family metallopeptidase [Pedobacter sp. MR2016-24]MCX2486129.1 insulinase family protein [Pedobacter sp. MR2016-24]